MERVKNSLRRSEKGKNTLFSGNEASLVFYRRNILMPKMMQIVHRGKCTLGELAEDLCKKFQEYLMKGGRRDGRTSFTKFC